MREITIKEIAQALDCAVIGADDITVRGISTDSRTIQAGDLFLAIPGETVNGHNYIAAARKKGAAAAVISEDCVLPEDMTAIRVKDSVEFLQNLAAWIRKKSALPLVAITGSYGKTTVKDMLRSILQRSHQIVATQGNRNNELGLPLTLCKIDAESEFVVTEMGMRGLGQIDFLCRIAQPNYGIISNIGVVHSEILGSKENIAKAKCELMKYIPQNGAIALNWRDRDFIQPYLSDCRGEIIWYHCDKEQNGMCAENILLAQDSVTYTLKWQGEAHEIVLSLPGEHNVANSMAAIAIARKLGIAWEEIIEALKHIELSAMRLHAASNTKGTIIINDAYNANPEAMCAALAVLANYKDRRKIAVLGDMYELGQYTQSGHRAVGDAAEKYCDKLLAVGELGSMIGEGALESGMQKEDVFFAKDNQTAIAILKDLLEPTDVVLVKASRGMKMEEIVSELMG